ncbi:MAG: aldo/keto reductase [Anaerolineae bacterium]
MTTYRIPRRTLGRTGLDVSVLGLGGFHQVEVGQQIVSDLLDTFLEANGNYVETARSYGAGSSERKLGHALQGRRDRVVLVSKTAERTAEGAWRELNESLEALGTDHLDILLYHCLTEADQIETIAGPGGACEAVARAREQGLVRFVGASAHWPMLLISAMERLGLDAIMYWVNYLVTCNYPELYRTIAPAARERGVGIIGMKPLGDGYLHRSVKAGFDYALAQEVDVIACGFNGRAMLEADIEAVCAWERPSPERLAEILRDAPELGDYVCRQCGECRLADLDLPYVFELEGKFDQQMFDGRSTDAPDYALRQRLCYWFQNQERAIEMYKPYVAQVAALLQAGGRLPACPYGIDLGHKLKVAHAKLTSSPDFPAGVVTF